MRPGAADQAAEGLAQRSREPVLPVSTGLSPSSCDRRDKATVCSMRLLGSTDYQSKRNDLVKEQESGNTASTYFRAGKGMRA